MFERQALPIGFSRTGGSGPLNDVFWVAVSLAVLVVLLGLLIFMVVEDLQRSKGRGATRMRS
jgi:hypothetical protein